MMDYTPLVIFVGVVGIIVSVAIFVMGEGDGDD